MTLRELLSKDPKLTCTDKYSGSAFTIAELTPIIIDMIRSSQQDADDFCERFVIGAEAVK